MSMNEVFLIHVEKFIPTHIHTYEIRIKYISKIKPTTIFFKGIYFITHHLFLDVNNTGRGS